MCFVLIKVGIMYKDVENSFTKGRNWEFCSKKLARLIYNILFDKLTVRAMPSHAQFSSARNNRNSISSSLYKIFNTFLYTRWEDT